MHRNKIAFVLLVTLLNLQQFEVLEVKVLHGPYHPPPIYRICNRYLHSISLSVFKSQTILQNSYILNSVYSFISLIYECINFSR